MKPHGCEIEAKGISYQIPISKRPHPLKKIWSREQVDHLPNGSSSEEESCNNSDDVGKVKYGARSVLKNVSCRAKPSEILAIVGPSGAGKSTLLEILAGKITPPTPPTILINQRPVDKSDFRRISGYVTQKDTLFPLLTVRETLMFSARLRLGCGGGCGLSHSQLSSRVEALLRELGLERVADARVGDDAHVRGISGGERRRVSIGVDIVHDPRILILDEPTSGLDSTSALQIVDTLKAMAEMRGRTIILSIHQPGFRILKLFGSVLLLADGAVLHQGSLDQLHSHLRSLGLELPRHANVLEFAIDSIDTLRCSQLDQDQQQADPPATKAPPFHLPKKLIDGGEAGKRDRCTLQQLFQQHKVVDEESLAGLDDDLSYDYANSRLREIAILTHRFSKNVLRTKQLFACRTIQMLVSGLVLGSIFYHLKDENIRERVGLFAFILTFLLSCTTEALPIFLQEREILMKETSSGSYRVSSYVIANGLVFLPFLFVLAVLFSVPVYWLAGLRPSFLAFMYFLLLIWLILYTANSVVVCFSALAPNFIIGNSIISGVMGTFFLFSGYFITKQWMPSYWVFMHYISLFKYPFEGFLINEFAGAGKCLEYAFGVCLVRGDDVLREEGLREECRWKNVMMMVGFILTYRLFSYLILRCRCRCVQKGGLRRALV